MPVRFFAVVIVSALIFSACSTAQGRENDVAPVPETVPDEASAVVIERELPASENQTDDVAPIISFNINGGGLGFCDELTITLAGEYILNSCKQGQVTGTLKQSDKASLAAWRENLASFQLGPGDSPGAAAGIVTDLIFVGQGDVAANDAQKQVLYDWVNGLVASMQPKPEVPPAASVPVAIDGLCPDVPRPALVLLDFENPGVVFLQNVDSQAACNVELAHTPFGRIIAAGGNLYYPVADSEATTVTMWQFDANGGQAPLEFTQLKMEEPAPHGFVVSDDGSKIAWSQTVLDYETDPPTYNNYLWLANIDGAEQVTVLDGVTNDEQRFVAPLRFSTADNTLYYALQPDIGGPVFNGRFDNLYSVPATGGEPQQVYACPAEENPICISGLAQDGSALSVLDPTADAIQVLNPAGEVLNTIQLPATDYVERTAFGPDGSLAFVSATFAEPASEDAPPLPNPGYITVMNAPYTEPAQTLLSDNSVGTLWGWLDDIRLAYGTIDEAGNTGTAVVTLDGSITEISPKFAAAVLQ